MIDPIVLEGSMENPDLLVLAELAMRMRTAQKAYFRARSREALIESKKLEAELDKAVANIFSQQRKELT